jgi:spermidine synthase
MMLLPLALALGQRTLREWFQANKLLAGGLVAGGLAFAALIDSPYDLETRYFSIAVLDGEKEGRPVKKLVLDRLVHSEVDLSDPTWLGYKHEVIQGEFVRILPEQSEVLIIGGGGYTLPKWIESQQDLNSVQIDVVEIDPGVTEIAHCALGLPRDTRAVSYNLDGRQFVKQSPAAAYGLIVQDAVNDYSVPYHLMTREYNDLIRRSLRDDGVYLLTVIDSLTEGPFLRAAVRTLQQSFAEVHVLAPTDDWENRERCVYVLAAFNSADQASRTLDEITQANVFVLPAQRLAAILSRDGRGGVVLTDDYAPVDTLMTRVYLGGN